MAVTGAFVKEGAGTLEVDGIFSATGGTTVNSGAIEANLATSQTVTLDGLSAYTDCATDSSNGYGAKFVTPNAGLLTLSGTGAVSADDTLTVASGSFTGAISGDMGLSKTGDGTFTLFGNQTFEGDVSISGGTLKLATPLDLDGLRADFDASAEDAIGELDDGTVTWKDANSSAVLTNLSTSATLVEDDAIFGGRSVLYSDSFQMVEPQIDAFYTVVPKSTFFVLQQTDGGRYAIAYDHTYYEIKGWNIAYRNVSSGLMVREYGTDSGDKGYNTKGTWKNSSLATQNNASGGIWLTDAKPAVVTVVQTNWTRTDKNSIARIGGKGKQAWAEYLTYNRNFTYDEKAAVEQYLMAKWGIGDATYNALPATANVTLSNGATLDLGGQKVTVASLKGAGTVQNGTLRTANNVVTVTGNLTIPVTDNTTYVIPADVGEIRLRLIGTAMNVTVDASAITKPLHIYYEGDLTLSVPKRWENYTHANGVYHIGSNPFVIRIR